MNTVTDLLARVHEYGVELLPERAEYYVRIHPPATLPDELMYQLRQNKPALLSYLRQCSYFRYQLRGGAGSIHRTHTSDLVAARAELVETYGDRLVMVAPA